MEQTAFFFDNMWLGYDEFRNALEKLDMIELAEMSGESIAYTRQMMELSWGLEDKAEILGVEMKRYV